MSDRFKDRIWEMENVLCDNLYKCTAIVHCRSHGHLHDPAQIPVVARSAIDAIAMVYVSVVLHRTRAQSCIVLHRTGALWIVLHRIGSSLCSSVQQPAVQIFICLASVVPIFVTILLFDGSLGGFTEEILK